LQAVSSSPLRTPDLAWFESVLLGDSPPSHALNDALTRGDLASHPELTALVGVQQDPKWHPEGDVWTHTLMVVDKAWELARAKALPRDQALQLLLGALTHDFGKPLVTR